LFVFAKKCIVGSQETKGGEDERRQRARSAAGCASSGLGDLSANHDKYLAEAYAEDEKKSK
jgi:hypothetical protein